MRWERERREGEVPEGRDSERLVRRTTKLLAARVTCPLSLSRAFGEISGCTASFTRLQLVTHLFLLPCDPSMPDTDQLSDTQGSYTPAPSSEAALAEHRVHELACCRISPRPCVNQRLVDELSVLREWRFLQHGSELRDSSTSLTSSDAHPSPHFLLRLAAPPESLSYATAVSVIIGTPFLITSAEQAQKLPKVRPVPAAPQKRALDTGASSRLTCPARVLDRLATSSSSRSENSSTRGSSSSRVRGLARATCGLLRPPDRDHLASQATSKSSSASECCASSQRSMASVRPRARHVLRPMAR